jgi:2-C-methyl-D-erythritol 2,4-cyclodiphosphate synthase
MTVPFRVGIGYDVHRFSEGRPLKVGGVTIPHPFGLLGHSDADVLLHAICDALLGAAGLGDIGNYFSDRDPKWRGSDSCVFLERVGAMLAERGWKIGNIDATLVAEAPKFAPYLTRMQTVIAAVLKISAADVNLKATTEEKMGFTGAYEGMSAQAVALIYEDRA